MSTATFGFGALGDGLLGDPSYLPTFGTFGFGAFGSGTFGGGTPRAVTVRTRPLKHVDLSVDALDAAFVRLSEVEVL